MWAEGNRFVANSRYVHDRGQPLRHDQMTLRGFDQQLRGMVKMAVIYDDNFGFWDIDGPEERAFFEHVQRQSVYMRCGRCERRVRLMQPQILCATCISALECGAPASINEYDQPQSTTLELSPSVTTASSSPSLAASCWRGHRRNERMAAQRSTPL